MTNEFEELLFIGKLKSENPKFNEFWWYQLQKDLSELEEAIGQLKKGHVGTAAARIRYLAALASRSAENAGIPRTTECRWDLTANAKERSASREELEG